MPDLLNCRPHLRSLYSAALLDSPMVDLDAPSLVGELLALLVHHLKMVGCVVFNVPVLGDRLEHLHEPVTLDMNNSPFSGYLDAADRYVFAIVRIDQTVALHSGKPTPSEVPADELKVIKRRVPAIEDHVPRPKPPLSGHSEHIPEMLVLVPPSEWTVLTHRLVVDAEVARYQPLAVGPQGRDEIYPLHHIMVLATPVVSYETNLLRVRLV